MTGHSTATPALSVIIPAYNRASFLSACVGSVRASGFDDLEVIVVDDGSTDETREVAARLDVRYEWQPNAGPSAARNRGLEISRGRFVAFLDSDDTWRPNVVGRLVRVLDDAPDVGAVFTDALVGSEASGYASLVARRGRASLLSTAEESVSSDVWLLGRVAFFRLLTGFNWMFLGATLFRRDAVAQAGAFDASSRQAEDWDLCLRVAASHQIAFADDVLAYYSTHDEGRLSTHVENMNRGFAMALLHVRGHASLAPPEQKLVNDRLRSLLFGYAYMAYDRGDFGEARARLRWLADACGHDARPLVYSLILRLPPSLIRAIRRVSSLFNEARRRRV